MPICNITARYPIDLADLLLQSTLLTFKEVRTRGDNEVERYYTAHRFRNMSFSIYPRKGYVIMKGSLAKFHNNGEHNYNDYSLADLCQDIAELDALFNYDFSKGLLHGLEAGVNLNLAQLPQPQFSLNFLVARLICYQGRVPFVPMKTIKGAGQGVECCLSNYRIKFYDKGTQYHRLEPILRIEYDCHQMRELQPIGIRRVSDLMDSNVLISLGRKIFKLFADCVFVEPLEESFLSVSERKLNEQAERPFFWQSIDRRKRAYDLKRFRKITETYTQYHIHETLNLLVRKTWKELIEDCHILMPISSGKCNNQGVVHRGISPFVNLMDGWSVWGGFKKPFSLLEEEFLFDYEIKKKTVKKYEIDFLRQTSVLSWVGGFNDQQNEFHFYAYVANIYESYCEFCLHSWRRSILREINLSRKYIGDEIE